MKHNITTRMTESAHRVMLYPDGCHGFGTPGHGTDRATIIEMMIMVSSIGLSIVSPF